MTKVLVIQGAGMNMRGKAQVEIFGPDTLEEINEQVNGYAEGLGLDVEFSIPILKVRWSTPCMMPMKGVSTPR